ncbi:hypothetical protein WKT02_04630 [Erysipelotrichaceae bacterium HCN-30851]
MDKYINSIPFNIIRLCIDTFNEYEITGTAYNNTTTSPISFLDINDLFLKFDMIFNKNGNPLASKTIRSFKNENNQYPYQNKPKTYCLYQALQEHKGKTADFDVVVVSRNNNTWQGSLFYKNQEYPYTTILDLIKIIIKLLNNPISN